MCLSIARWFRDDGARTAGQVADEYADFALRIVGYVPDRLSPARRVQQGPDDPGQ
jgi:Tetracyclin repressor-like, C-terminal domain